VQSTTIFADKYISKRSDVQRIGINVLGVYSGQIDPPFRLIDPLAGGNIPEGQPKNGFTMNA